MLPSGRKMSPRLVYDGECGFCRYTVDYAHAITGDDVEYLRYQDVADQYPGHTPDDFARSSRSTESRPTEIVLIVMSRVSFHALT